MDQEIIKKVCDHIYNKFPEVKGKRPRIKSYTSSQSLLIFNGKVKAADGQSIPRTVRVVVGKDGKIGKITTSR